MRATSTSSQTLVVDASIAVWAVLPTLQDDEVDAAGHFARWANEGVKLVAPSWWTVECTSTIRRLLANGVISAETARVAISDLSALEVELLAIGQALCESALDWAARIGQSKAYDAFYLALAEQEGAELWTADRRLATSARAAKAGWVHWAGEKE